MPIRNDQDSVALLHGEAPISVGGSEDSDTLGVDATAIEHVAGHPVVRAASTVAPRVEAPSIDAVATRILEQRLATASAPPRPAPEPLRAAPVPPRPTPEPPRAAPVMRAPDPQAPPPPRAPQRTPWQDASSRTRIDQVEAHGATRQYVARERTANDVAGRSSVVFHSAGFAPGNWAVRAMHGVARVSELYEYELEIEARFEYALDPEEVELLLTSQATVAYGEDALHPTHGIVVEAELLSESDDNLVVYRVRLTPQLWLLTQTTRSRIFSDLTVKQVVESVLRASGMNRFEFQLSLTHDKRFPKCEYIVQYRESDYQFVQRLLAHEGIFFCFDQRDDGDHVVFSDEIPALRANRCEEPIAYVSLRGVDHGVTSLRRISRRQTREVVLNDYNWRLPSQPIVASAVVSDRGFGASVVYGEHYKTAEEGKALAAVRAHELAAMSRVYHGRSRVRSLVAGSRFTLSDHSEESFEREYFVLEVKHAVIDGGVGVDPPGVAYANEFVAIEASQPYAPPRVVPWPVITGLVHGRIIGTKDGANAPIDEFGRYRVALPWVLADNAEGVVSRWVRRAQASAGPNYGSHFTLHVGTEVVIAHIEGDPDRPVIVGAVHDAEQPAPVTQANANQSIIQTRHGVRFVMTDG